VRPHEVPDAMGDPDRIQVPIQPAHLIEVEIGVAGAAEEDERTRIPRGRRGEPHPGREPRPHPNQPGDMTPELLGEEPAIPRGAGKAHEIDPTLVQDPSTLQFGDHRVHRRDVHRLVGVAGAVVGADDDVAQPLSALPHQPQRDQRPTPRVHEQQRRQPSNRRQPGGEVDRIGLGGVGPASQPLVDLPGIERHLPGDPGRGQESSEKRQHGGNNATASRRADQVVLRSMDSVGDEYRVRGVTSGHVQPACSVPYCYAPLIY
jgi:hypothetical protein